jgi:hypothetical protein
MTTGFKIGRASGWLAAAGGLLLAAGCVSTGPRCQFAISNVGEDEMCDVVLRAPDGQVYRTGTIPARAEANYVPTDLPVGGDAAVDWKGPDGTPLSRAVALSKPVPRSFRGRVVYERDATNAVKAFVLEDLSEKASPLPWGKPESWEGTVGIPGMMPDDGR